MVRRIKEKHGIKCRRHKRFKITTDSKHNKIVYPNVLVSYAINKHLTADLVCQALNIAIKNKQG